MKFFLNLFILLFKVSTYFFLISRAKNLKEEKKKKTKFPEVRENAVSCIFKFHKKLYSSKYNFKLKRNSKKKKKSEIKGIRTTRR